MKKLILIGRVGSGKTTLMQKLSGEALAYSKTQAIRYDEHIIDTPGEYAETNRLGGALAVYSFEADVVGLVLSGTEQYSLYSPNIASLANREVIGIVTKTDLPEADPDRAERWLRLTGCKTIFRISSVSGDGISDIIAYLSDP